MVAGAQIIVTLNLRDFPATALRGHGIEVSSPDQFLLDLQTTNPGLLASIIERQAAALSRPPTSVERVIENIAVQAPRFSAALRQMGRSS